MFKKLALSASGDDAARGLQPAAREGQVFAVAV